MKSILLASASIVAFAGAAAAEITFGGSATLGYNDTDTASDTDDDLGFFWDANVAVTMSQELDNGLTASATFDFDVADNSTELDISSASYVLSLTSDMGGLYFGETANAPETYWVSAGDMAADNFSETDGETVLRGEVMFGGVTAGVSYYVDDANDELEQLGVGATGSFGNFTFALAYQEESDWTGGSGDFDGSEVLGVSVGTSFAGADVQVAYAQNSTADTNSIGVEVAYPFGPVTVGAFYVVEDGAADDSFGLSADYASGPISVAVYYEEITGGDEDWAVEGSYDLGNGLVILAGSADAGEDYYVAGQYDLGSGAQLLVSFADDGDDDAEDEIGDPEYKDGTTVEVTFEF